MRTLLLMLCIVSASYGSPADSAVAARPGDVSSPDAILTALYDVISGPAGQARDFDRLRSLFLPGANMIATGKRPDGLRYVRRMSVEDYIAASGPMLVQSGFTEKEIGRVTESFGGVMHAFSAYEGSFTRPDGSKAGVRGVNSIQLLNDDKRWWVVSIFWQAEDASLKIPTRYLQMPE